MYDRTSVKGFPQIQGHFIAEHHRQKALDPHKGNNRIGNADVKNGEESRPDDKGIDVGNAYAVGTQVPVSGPQHVKTH